jgi:LacI family transcriptional regulator, galactose operon repressor
VTTLRDVARHADVSPMTVSRVVNGSGRVSPDLRARVEQALAETGYLPNTVARNLRTRRTDTIALVMPDMTNPFFTALAHGVEMSAREVGVSLLVANSDEREDEEQRLVQVLLQRQVDGILLIPAGAGGVAIGRCRAHDVPVVIVDRRPGTPGVDVVRADAEAGAFQLGRLMAGLGHRRMAVLTGPASVPTAVDRAVGFSRALADDSALATPSVVYGAFTIESGHAMTLSVMGQAPRPTALFAANNFIAIGVLHALQELGLLVPDDVAVVGFDDLPQAMVTFPFLTVAAQPAFELGRRSVAVLLDRLADPRRPAQEVVLPTEIVLRRSSGGRIGESVQG